MGPALNASHVQRQVATMLADRGTWLSFKSADLVGAGQQRATSAIQLGTA
jgi:hypothetical protein